MGRAARGCNAGAFAGGVECQCRLLSGRPLDLLLLGSSHFRKFCRKFLLGHIDMIRLASVPIGVGGFQRASASPGCGTWMPACVADASRRWRMDAADAGIPSDCASDG